MRRHTKRKDNCCCCCCIIHRFGKKCLC